MFHWDTSFYSVSQFLNNFPDLHLFTSLVFSNDRWNLPALFVDNCQMLWTINHLSSKREIFLLQVASYKGPFKEL